MRTTNHTLQRAINICHSLNTEQIKVQISRKPTLCSVQIICTVIRVSGKCVSCKVDCVWNMMAHAQKPDYVFRRNGRVHLNRRGRQFSRLLAAEVCPSAVVALDTPYCELVWRVLATHSIHQFPLHFPSRASPCAFKFQLDSYMSEISNYDTQRTWL